MPAPFTIVTLTDEDGDEFPIRLPGVYPSNRGADIEAAIQLAAEEHPTVKFDLDAKIEYVGDRASA